MLAIASDTFEFLNGLQTNDGTFVNDATVTGQILSLPDCTVLYSFSLMNIDSNGNYQGTIPASFTSTLTPGTSYNIVLTAVATQGQLVVVQNQTANYKQG